VWRFRRQRSDRTGQGAELRLPRPLSDDVDARALNRRALGRRLGFLDLVCFALVRRDVRQPAAGTRDDKVGDPRQKSLFEGAVICKKIFSRWDRRE
jgi:hypothetical protein